MAPRVRYEAHTPAGIAMLQIYAGAVASMNALATGDPHSWKFQWNTHSIASGSKAATIAAAYPPGTPAQKVIALAAWNTCAPHFGGPVDYFLPWHRMFVLSFENIIRDVSGNQKFTLPYWDYCAPGSTHAVMPPQFRMSSDPVFGPLYRSNRNVTPNPNVNGGAPIDQGDPSLLSLNVLKKCHYSRIGVVNGFCADLNAGLHGNVHGAVGDGTNMGTVPTAAGDPIFWMHHCNIDRLWASWNNAGRANPATPAFLNQQYTFAGPAGTGVTWKVQDVLSIAALGYSYDKLAPVPLCLTRPGPRVTQLATIKRVAIGPDPVHAKLLMEPAQAATEKLTLKLPALSAEQGIFLVLDNIQTNVSPNTLYRVYLGMPAGTTGAAREAYRVGTINFFEAASHAEGATNMEPPHYSFDVTALVKRLGAAKTITDEPTVSIVPSSKPSAEARPLIGNVLLVQQ